MLKQYHIYKDKIFGMAKRYPITVNFNKEDFLKSPTIIFNNNSVNKNIGNFISEIRHKKTNYDDIVSKMYNVIGIRLSPKKFQQIIKKKEKTDYEKFIYKQYRDLDFEVAIGFLHKRINYEIFTMYGKLIDNYLIEDYQNNCLI